VKIEYLRRELLRAALHRLEFRYPRLAARPRQDMPEPVEAAV
jgi:hypothetical protein